MESQLAVPSTLVRYVYVCAYPVVRYHQRYASIGQSARTVAAHFFTGSLRNEVFRITYRLLGIVCMACASPAILAGTHWFLFVVVISFIATLIWASIHLLSIREALTLPINWILTEMLNTAIVTVLYVTAFIVQLSIWSPSYSSHYRAPNIAAGIFGLFNALAYGAGSYLLYAEWKSSTTPTQ